MIRAFRTPAWSHLLEASARAKGGKLRRQSRYRYGIAPSAAMVVLALTTGGLSTPVLAEELSIRITSPADGVTVAMSPEVRLKATIRYSGDRYPDAAFFVDGDWVPGVGDAATWDNTRSPGPHTITAEVTENGRTLRHSVRVQVPAPSPRVTLSSDSGTHVEPPYQLRVSVDPHDYAAHDWQARRIRVCRGGTANCADVNGVGTVMSSMIPGADAAGEQDLIAVVTDNYGAVGESVALRVMVRRPTPEAVGEANPPEPSEALSSDQERVESGGLPAAELPRQNEGEQEAPDVPYDGDTAVALLGRDPTRVRVGEPPPSRPGFASPASEGVPAANGWRELLPGQAPAWGPSATWSLISLLAGAVLVRGRGPAPATRTWPRQLWLRRGHRGTNGFGFAGHPRRVRPLVTRLPRSISPLRSAQRAPSLVQPMPGRLPLAPSLPPRRPAIPTASGAMTAKPGSLPATSMLPSAGQYRLLQLLGRGGQGSVYLAQAHDHKLVAVKMVPGDEVRALEREVLALQRVRSPHFPELLDFDLLASPPYVAMEYIHGLTLETRLRRHERLSELDVQRIAGDLLHALITLHAAGIAHRDVKPANALLARRGAVLVDLGIAGDLSRTSATTRSHYSPGYTAPERMNGERGDSACDIWSWAVTVFEMLTGVLPIRGHVGALTARWRDLLAPALRADPATRPDAADLLGLLGRMQQTQTPHEESRGVTVSHAALAATVWLQDESTQNLPTDASAHPTEVLT